MRKDRRKGSRKKYLSNIIYKKQDKTDLELRILSIADSELRLEIRRKEWLYKREKRYTDRKRQNNHKLKNKKTESTKML